MPIKFTLKKTLIFLIASFIWPNLISSSYADNSAEKLAAEKPATHKNHHTDKNNPDSRISLNLPPHMQQHQLATMRGHLEAVQTIVDLIAKSEFTNASAIAHQKLGLTEEMKHMCEMINNQEFRELGMAFHKSADALSEALLTQNIDASLKALNTTLGYCTQCHAQFRQ